MPPSSAHFLNVRMTSKCYLPLSPENNYLDQWMILSNRGWWNREKKGRSLPQKTSRPQTTVAWSCLGLFALFFCLFGWLGWNSPCSLGWSQTPKPPASVSLMLGSTHVPPHATCKANLEGKPDLIILRYSGDKRNVFSEPRSSWWWKNSRMARPDITKEFDYRALC